MMSPNFLKQAELAIKKTCSYQSTTIKGKILLTKLSRELDVPGYTSDMLNNTTWKNIKQVTPLNLKVIKQSSSGEQPLEGAVFQLKGGILDVTLKDNHDGTYSLPDNARLRQKEEPY